MKKKKILCLGDSLTFGSAGYSYINGLSNDFKVINKGVNGDTTICAFGRLKSYINNKKYKDVDRYIISIGTNDILLPYLSSISISWKIQTNPSLYLKKCINDDNDFEIEYEKYLKLLKENNKEAILIGIPLLQLRHFSYDSIKRRNLIIFNLANKYNFPFIDIFEIQRLMCNDNFKEYSWKYKNINRIIDYIIMALFPFTKNIYSKGRKLEFTVDGVHFNKLSADLLAKEVKSRLKGDNYEN